MSSPVHPYKEHSGFYNFLFHPRHNKETRIAAIITNIVLSILTLSLWQIIFWTINRLDHRKLKLWKEESSPSAAKTSTAAKSTFPKTKTGSDKKKESDDLNEALDYVKKFNPATLFSFEQWGIARRRGKKYKFKTVDELKEIFKAVPEALALIEEHRPSIIKSPRKDGEIPTEFTEALLGILMAKEAEKSQEFHVFLKYMSDLTLYGGRKKKLIRALTEGLDKIRSYLCLRDPDQEQHIGKKSGNAFGVVEAVVPQLIRAYFQVRDPSDYFASIDDQMHWDERATEEVPGYVRVCIAQNASGVHFTLLAKGEKDKYLLYDTLSPEKVKTKVPHEGGGIRFTSTLRLKEEFYKNCGLPPKTLTAASQDKNNCFLSAAFLQFSIIIYYQNILEMK